MIVFTSWFIPVHIYKRGCKRMNTDCSQWNRGSKNRVCRRGSAYAASLSHL